MSSLERELRRGTLELILLHLLHRQDRYGYELVQQLESAGGEAFQVKEGTLYPILYRLEDAGWIESYRDNPKRGVPRKYYRLTKRGQGHRRELTESWNRYVAIVDALIGGEEAEA